MMSKRSTAACHCSAKRKNPTNGSWPPSLPFADERSHLTEKSDRWKPKSSTLWLNFFFHDNHWRINVTVTVRSAGPSFWWILTLWALGGMMVVLWTRLPTIDYVIKLLVELIGQWLVLENLFIVIDRYHSLAFWCLLGSRKMRYTWCFLTPHSLRAVVSHPDFVNGMS